MDKPAQRPEGVLLQQAMKRAGLSARKAASDIGISDARLRQIFNGYQPVGRGQFVEAVGPAETIARIAAHLNVSADDLRQAGRGDAADELDGLQSLARRRHPARGSQRYDDQAVTEFEEWAQRPGESPPPQGVLSMFDDQQVMDELWSRLKSRSEQVRDLLDLVRTSRRGMEGVEVDAGQAEAQKSNEVDSRWGADGQSETGGAPADPGETERRRVIKGRGGMDRASQKGPAE